MIVTYETFPRVSEHPGIAISRILIYFLFSSQSKVIALDDQQLDLKGSYNATNLQSPVLKIKPIHPEEQPLPQNIPTGYLCAISSSLMFRRTAIKLTHILLFVFVPSFWFLFDTGLCLFTSQLLIESVVSDCQCFVCKKLSLKMEFVAQLTLSGLFSGYFIIYPRSTPSRESCIFGTFPSQSPSVMVV